MKNKTDFLNNMNIEDNKNQNLDEHQLSNEMIEQVSGGSFTITIIFYDC